MKTRPAKPIPLHDYCKLLPRMTDLEFEALKQTIIDAGKIIDPGIVYEGKLLDGRHRQEASIQLGIAFPTRKFDPDRDGRSPLDMVKARATHRNMTESQKAAAAVGVLDTIEAEAAKRQKATQFTAGSSGGATSCTTEADPLSVTCPDCDAEAGKTCVTLGTKHTRVPHVTRIKVAERAAKQRGKSRDVAAGMFGVSGFYVQQAKFVRQHDPELFAQVFDGHVTVTAARAEVRRAIKRKELQQKANAAVAPHGEAPAWEIVHGDCMKVLPTLQRRRFKLIAIDPPYNEGIDYGKGGKADLLAGAKYEAFFHACLGEAFDLLTDDGTIVVIINNEWAAEYVMCLKGLGLHMRGWIKWYETFGVNCSDTFNRTSRHILYFTKSKSQFTFDREVFSRPSARQVVYNDGRANPAGKLWDDIWAVPRLVGNSRERMADFPTQIPLAVMRPIIAGFTEPGDEVCDFFSGSGTTAVASVTQGRRFFGVEGNKHFAAESRTRVLAELADLTAHADGRTV